MSAIENTLYSVKTKAAMHDAIEKMNDNDHAILLIANPLDDERTVFAYWKNIVSWQGEGMLRAALRVLMQFHED